MQKSGIEKEQCSLCGRKVSFGTLYKVRTSHLCSWCNTNHKKGKTFNKKTKKWIGEVTEEKKQERRRKVIKWQLENITLRTKHFLGGQKESKELNHLSVRQVKSIESFFLED